MLSKPLYCSAQLCIPFSPPRGAGSGICLRSFFVVPSPTAAGRDASTRLPLACALLTLHHTDKMTLPAPRAENRWAGKSQVKHAQSTKPQLQSVLISWRHNGGGRGDPMDWLHHCWPVALTPLVSPLELSPGKAESQKATSTSPDPLPRIILHGAYNYLEHKLG